MAAYKTAITRKKLSKPARVLKDNDLLRGRILDYGCGRGGDTERIGCEGYDPHYRPGQPVGPFDTVMCNFVLNVIEDDEERYSVLSRISDLLDDCGCAYVAVRANKKDLRGHTKIGTWQGLIELDLPIVYKDSDCIIYEMHKNENFSMKAEIFI